MGRKKVPCPNGKFYLSWYERGKKKFENVGFDPVFAHNAQIAKASALAKGITEGAEIVDVSTGGRKTIAHGIEAWLRDLRRYQGKSGKGKSPKTLSAYEYRVGLFAEFCKAQKIEYLDQISHAKLGEYLDYLNRLPSDLSDRSIFNLFQTLCTFLRHHEIFSGIKIMKELDYEEADVESYEPDELGALFRACKGDEKLIFRFFLNSGCRESEVAHCEVGDLNFGQNVLHVRPKPHRKFRLKGKEDRFIPLPTALVRSLKTHCVGKKPGDLVFPNKDGNPEGHFLRRLQRIARDSKLAGSYGLHKFRKTFCTMLSADGVPVFDIMTRMGHADLKVTLRYLKATVASSAVVQAQVNAGSLAAYCE